MQRVWEPILQLSKVNAHQNQGTAGPVSRETAWRRGGGHGGRAGRRRGRGAVGPEGADEIRVGGGRKWPIRTSPRYGANSRSPVIGVDVVRSGIPGNRDQSVREGHSLKKHAKVMFLHMD